MSEDQNVSVLARHRARLLNAKTPMRHVPDPGETEGVYGVSTEGNDCVISLGNIPPFRVPKNTAIKFAMLILRRCGVEVVDDG